jgi:UDP-2,4-diacetamido-2,4,6-trideoxy-beta-L-altropyranose hydrolase
MSAGLLVLRADGGPGIGSGHLGRQLALAEAWRDAGGQVRLVTHTAPLEWVQRYQAEGVEVVEPSTGWERSGAAWTSLDGYRFDIRLQERLRSGGRLLVVDDHGTIGRYAADLVLDQNLGASDEMYRHRSGDTELLLGFRYALLRREFRRSPADPPVPAHARRLLVSLGGDPPDWAVRGVEVAVARVPELAARWMSGGGGVAEAMAASDMALSGAGVTAWELCAMGVPSVLLVLADNQRPVAEGLVGAGASVSAGDGGVEPDELALLLGSLAADPAMRRKLADTGRRLVDGRGARRVVTRLLASLVSLRPAEASDARQLWEWVNEPHARAMSFTQRPIPWEEHVEWLGAKLRDPDSHIFMAELEGRPVGQVRFDVAGTDAEIAISVDAVERGRGLGAALIAAATRRLFETSPTGAIVARVRPENRASAMGFLDGDYQFEAEESDGQLTWLRYAFRRDDS